MFSFLRCFLLVQAVEPRGLQGLPDRTVPAFLEGRFESGGRLVHDLVALLRGEELEADRQAHTRQRPALEQQVQEADRTAAAQSARVQALEQQVLAKQKALPYPQRAQAQAALDLLEADRTALRAGMEQAEAALRTAQQNYAAAKAAVDALRSQQAAAQSSAPAQPPETLREAAAELTAARDAARGQEKQLAARLLPNRRIAEQYRTAAAQHADDHRG